MTERGRVQGGSLRIGLLHLAPDLGAVETNRALIERATIVAAELGADWVVSGELVVSGYRFDDRIGTAWIANQPDPWLQHLAHVGAEQNVISFVSHPELDAATGKLFNTLFVLGRDARLLGRHRKLCPTPESEAWCSPGAPADPVDVDGIRVGLLICADAYPPGPAARLRRLGAELIVSAAAWWPGEHGPHGEWEARSQETGLPFVICNRTGFEGDPRLAEAESVVVADGVRRASFRSPRSTVFVVRCDFRRGTIADCVLESSASL